MEIDAEPATAGDSMLPTMLSPVITGFNCLNPWSWGSRPRLYANARFAG